jgi:hypothetical protein
VFFLDQMSYYAIIDPVNYFSKRLLKNSGTACSDGAMQDSDPDSVLIKDRSNLF